MENAEVCPPRFQEKRGCDMMFPIDEVIDDFLHRDLRTELSTNGCVKYVSDA